MGSCGYWSLFWVGCVNASRGTPLYECLNRKDYKGIIIIGIMDSQLLNIQLGK
jgi:hypothetical protein